MNGVNNQGHARQMRRPPPQKPSLAAMGMDKIRARLPKESAQPQQGDEISEGSDRTDQRREEGQGLGAMTKSRFQAAFHGGARPAHELNLAVGKSAQPQHRGDGVFLRAANDQTCDDMDDTHITV